MVDGVYSLRCSESYPFAEGGGFYTQDNIPQYEEIPNSIYHSEWHVEMLLAYKIVDVC